MSTENEFSSIIGCARECELRSKSCRVTTVGRFILTREARTPARTSARTCRNGCKRSKERRFEEMRLQGRRALREVVECEYYGTEAITRNFPFALRLSSLFFPSPYYRRKGRGEERGGRHEDRVRLPRLFSRARACTQMRDG